MRRHRFDPFSLVFGATFLAIGTAFVAGSTIDEAWRSIWPMVTAIVGVTLVAWAVLSVLGEARRKEGTVAVEPPGEIATSASDVSIDEETGPTTS